MAMIEIKNLNKWYGNFQVLKNCNVTVEKGEVVVVCGPSGSGKSTLIKTVNALEPFQEGEIIVDGVSVGDPKTDLPKLRSRVGMVFQHFELFPHLSIKENLILAQMKVLWPFPRRVSYPRPEAAGSSRSAQACGKVSWSAFRRSAAACGYCPCTRNGSYLHAL